MDRALKERIIGAIVLVLFVVLVVPVFLDGPSDNTEVISERVPLPGQKGQENQTIVLDRNRSEPVPAMLPENVPEVQAEVKREPVRPPQPQSTPGDTVEKDTPPSAQTKVEPKTEPEAAAKTPQPAPEEKAPASATGMWAVQLGSFGDEDNANKLAADLRKQKFTAFLSTLSTGGKELHRVRIGPLQDRKSAEAVAEQLRKAGHKGQVVPHP